MANEKMPVGENNDDIRQKVANDQADSFYSIKNIKKKIDIEIQKEKVLLATLNNTQRELFDEYSKARSDVDDLIKMHLIMTCNLY